MKNYAFWAKVTVSMVLCVVLLWRIDWSEIADTLKAANRYWVFAVFITIHIDRLFMAYKWKVLLKGSGISVSNGAVLKAYYVGSFWGSFLPLSGGGDVVRVGWFKKRVRGSSWIISSVIIERLLGSLALSLVALGSFIMFTVSLDLSLPVLSVIVFLLLAGSVVTVSVVFSSFAHGIVQKLIVRLPFHGVSGMVEKVRGAIFAFKEKPGLLIAFLGLSILEQVFPIIGTFMLAKAFSIDLSLMWAMIGVPIIIAVSTMPISVNGFGLQEGAYAFVFSFAGIPLGASVMMSVTARVLMLLATLPGAFLWTIPSSKNSSRFRCVSWSVYSYFCSKK